MNNDGTKKRVTVEGIVRSIRKGKTWNDVALEYGFDTAEKIRSFTKERCNHSVFRDVDKKAKKNQ